METQAKTIQSWRGQRVRIKREYIEQSEPELDEDESTFDDDGNLVIGVYSKPYYYINTPNGMNGVLNYGSINALDRTFYVQSDCYGVDLYKMSKNKASIDDLPAPSHQIIVEESGYPFMWEAKYFEVVTTKVIHEVTTDNEFNNQ